MTTEAQMTAWSHLPNAAHIDRILADVAENGSKWDAAQKAAWNSAWNSARNAAWEAASDSIWHADRDAARRAAYDAARSAAWNSARNAAYDAAWDAAYDAAYDAARSAIMALIAWDSASDFLDCNPEHVRLLAVLGDHRAVLMLPAVIAMDVNK